MLIAFNYKLVFFLCSRKCLEDQGKEDTVVHYKKSPFLKSSRAPKD